MKYADLSRIRRLAKGVCIKDALNVADLYKTLENKGMTPLLVETSGIIYEERKEITRLSKVYAVIDFKINQIEDIVKNGLNDNSLDDEKLSKLLNEQSTLKDCKALLTDDVFLNEQFNEIVVLIDEVNWNENE